MAVVLIEEDGTGVLDANSYGGIDAARQYALDRGVTLSDNDKVASQLILGTDYLESFADQYVGQPVSVTQALSWPRKNVLYSDGSNFPVNQLPTQLVAALYQCVIEQFNGIVLQPSVDYSQGGFILDEKVGPIETKYSEKIGTSSAPLLSKVQAMLKSLLTPMSALRTVRI